MGDGLNDDEDSLKVSEERSGTLSPNQRSLGNEHH